jgi:hypothetical protein
MCALLQINHDDNPMLKPVPVRFSTTLKTLRTQQLAYEVCK